MAFVLVVVAGLYALALFRVAWRVDRTAVGGHWVDRPLAYALSLGVYCTSWTFFGAVGSAATGGWTYLPIYLGPTLLFLFGRDFLRRLAEAVKRENLTSIADYVSSRFGKSRSLAAVVAGLAVLAALPYVALQLKSLAMSAGAMLSSDPMAPDEPSPPVVAAIAAALALFAIMFGARRYEATGKNRGLVAAIAVESAVKLVALALVGAFAAATFLAAPPEARSAGLAAFSQRFSLDALEPNFVTITLLSMCAIICLPRQFYMGFVEYRDERDLSSAHWALPAYMAATALVVLPITLAGLAVLPAQVPGDLYVLDLPLAAGADWLALVAFMGGFAAATGMIVVECVALSTMVANDLAAPFLLRRAAAAPDGLGARLLLARRIAIAAVMGLAFLFYLAMDRGDTLASVGLVAFAGVAQFAPGVAASLYWSQANRRGVQWGLVAGGAVWLYTLFLPTVFGAPLIEPLSRAFGGMLHPQALFGVGLGDPLTHGAVWSLSLNLAFLVLGSKAAPAAIADRLRAAVFAPGAFVGGEGGARTAGDLMALVERFVGAAEARRAFEADAPAFAANAPITPARARLAERLVAQVIGAPSARVIVASALTRGSLDVADVVSLIDDTKERLQFSRELLATTLDSISQGVSVVDGDLRLLAWNERYLQLFDFPAGFIHVGRPIADVIRYNAERGECGPGGVEAHVERRLAALRRRAPHTYERSRPNGMVLKSIGNPMPGGGYVTTFTDITAEKEAQAALQAANDLLEARVAERTAALTRANRELEAATLSKTKFLAAASHDLLQPLNAARLFSAALEDALSRGDLAARDHAHAIERSIAAADGLLRALLDISKLEAGGVVAKVEAFALAPLLTDLTAQFAPMAAAKGLKLRCAHTDAWVESDRGLLRSALQNFLSNAIRYTEAGGVLVGARRRGGRVAIEVWDTGPGVPEAHRRAIFEEFRRLHRGGEETAAGLGLAIVERIGRILLARLDLRSRVGWGSVFSIDAPRATPLAAPSPRPRAPSRLDGLRVLCVDNEEEILSGLRALLVGWGARPACARDFREACAALDGGAFDVALIDYHLGEGRDGLAVADRWRAVAPERPFALITASGGEELRWEVDARAGAFMTKPVQPEALRAFLADAL